MAGYILYSVALACIVVATALFLTRNRWIHRLTLPDYIYSRLPSSFTEDIEDGLTSSMFDLAENVSSGDSRAGLDHAAKKEVKHIMRSQKLNFDEARRLYMERSFAKNGIGVDGRPRDPKFVSFS